MKYLIILSMALFLAGCGTTKVQTIHHFETVEVPSHLLTCQVLVKSDIPKSPVKNFDVHALIQKIISKNGTCQANMKAVKKIIDDFNSKVDELNTP